MVAAGIFRTPPPDASSGLAGRLELEGRPGIARLNRGRIVLPPQGGGNRAGFVDVFCTIKEAEADRFFAEPQPLDFDFYLRTV